MRHLLQLRNYLGPYRKLISIAMLCTIMSGALVMVSPLLVRYAINIGLNPQSDSNGKLIGLDGNTGVLIAGAAAIVVFAMGRGLAQFGQQ